MPTPLGSKGKPDLSHVIKASQSLANYASPGSLVINESTSYPGTLREVILPIVDPSGVKVLFASAPERIDPLNKKWDVKNTPKLVAGLTDKARDRAVEFYSKFIDIVIPCSSLEVAETAKLLENSFRLINISFINELAIFCNKIGIDVQEVIKAASTKPYGYMPFIQVLESVAIAYRLIQFICHIKPKKSEHRRVLLILLQKLIMKCRNTL